ncbi:MAG: pyridoxal phosphate-dependent aminotransferase family protein [Cellvibrio sp.]|uniref:aminotransferase class I/II-fold pyridoxal phosphate-dependent enzyme n=1 Tax=Cellvibrio sp. TaxID=1965322 RepID=UPI00271D8731|nr:pyridoxal phosphate-dependent aminotransferase family protein [Cellvibrio sp.]
METIDSVTTKTISKRFDSILDISESHWDAIIPRATGLKHNVLQTFELSRVNNLICHYLAFEQGNHWIGKANIYETSMDFASLDKNLSPHARRLIKKWFPDYLNLSMAECGLFAMNGDGVVVKDPHHLTQVIPLIHNELQNIATEKNLDLLVFRDVPLEQYSIYEKILTPLGYTPSAGFTNAVIDIRWDSIEHYLESLNSKDRYKLKTALKIEEDFGIRVEITSDYKHLAKQMADLWRNVNASSDDYNREQLDEAFFYEAGARLQNNSEVILFYAKEKLVAFMWSLIGTEDYHMADWGVDYDYPQYREANFYRAASMISLKRAIALGKQRMQLGMTNYTPKKLLGAQMQPLVYFIKHQKNSTFTTIVNRMITDAIEQPPELNYYAAGSWPLDTMTADEYKSIFTQKLVDYTTNDALSRVDANYDIDILKLGGLYGFYPDIETINLPLSNGIFVNYNHHPEIINAANKAWDNTKATHNGAPFFSGESDATRALQFKLSQMVQQEAAQLLPNGNLIHQTALTPLLDSSCLVLLDEQTSPGIWEAVGPAGCEIKTFAHQDLADLEAIIIENTGRKILIIAETAFPLFGDQTDIAALVQLKQQYDTRLYVDESLTLGLCGKNVTNTHYRLGLSAQQGISDQIDVIVASTLSGLGIDAGFVAASTKVIEHIRHQATSLLFAGSLSAAQLAMLSTALDLAANRLTTDSELFAKTEFLTGKLIEQGFNAALYQSPIINLIFTDFMITLAVQKKLLQLGVAVAAIGQPLLPPDMSVIHLNLYEDITWEELKKLVDIFASIAIGIQLTE